jgi:hypothetical protein
MNAKLRINCFAAALLVGLFVQPALGSFHLMQIEQVIGGVNGDTSAQAIQLRMRAAGENFVSGPIVRSGCDRATPSC